MKAEDKVEEITCVRQSQEAEAAANYRDEPQDCNRLPNKAPVKQHNPINRPKKNM